MMCRRDERGVAGLLFLTEGLTPLVVVQPCALSLPCSPAPLASLAPALCRSGTGTPCPPAICPHIPPRSLVDRASADSWGSPAAFECW